MKIIFVFLIISIQTLVAQPGNINTKNATLETGTGSTPFIRATSKSMPKVKGTVYLNEEWKQASVSTLKEKKVVKLLARFNAYNKEIEILKEKDFVSLRPVAGISVELNGKKFIPFKANLSEKTIFAESLVQGKLALLKVFDIKILKATSDAALLNIDNEDRVIIVDKLYLKDRTGRTEPFPKKRKMLLAKFDKVTQEFIKSEKLSLKKEEDLIRVFEFYNKSFTESQKIEN